MRVVILHISDLHTNGNGSDLPAPETIVAELIERGLAGMPIFVAVTGDVIHKGEVAGFSPALVFLQALRESLRDLTDIADIHFFAVPGNHDCDSSASTTTRREDISLLLEGKTILDSTLWKRCVEVQAKFEHFCNVLEPDLAMSSDSFCRTFGFELDDILIQFTLMNSAYIERSGLERAVPILPPLDTSSLPSNSVKPTLSVALTHHGPLHFEGKSGTRLVELFRKHFDLVLVGHDHLSSETKLVDSDRNHVTHLLAGGVLHHPQDQSSQFMVMDCTIDSRSRSVEYSKFSRPAGSNHYECFSEETLQLSHVGGTPFQPTQDFQEILDDVGPGIKHPVAGQLKLSDIYVHPPLRVIRPDAKANSEEIDLHDGESIGPLAIREKRLLVCGGHRSGKSSLLKTLYHTLLANGVTPVYLKGQALTETRPEAIRKEAENAFKEQYSSQVQDVSHYVNLPKGRKAILIDDIGMSSLSARMDLKKNLLERLSGEFGVVVATESAAILTDASAIAALVGAENNYTCCEILRFSPKARGKLIEKWTALGLSEHFTEEEYYRRVDALEKHVDELLGPKTYPECPFIVLAVLHFRDSKKSITIGQGSLATLYRLLIEEDLLRAGLNVSMDEIRTFLAMAAFSIYEQATSLIGPRTMADLHSRYEKRVAMSLGLLPALNSLVEVGILAQEGDAYRFKHELVYHYYLAFEVSKGLRSLTKADQMTAVLNEMCSCLDSNQYLSTLQFLTQMEGENPVLVNALLSAIRSVLKGIEPLDLGKDAATMNSLVYKPFKLTLPASRDAHRARERRREVLECIEEEASQEDDAQKNANQLMTTTFNGILLLGSIVRNNPTTLAESKSLLIDEALRAGLRLLGDYYSETGSLLETCEEQLAQGELAHMNEDEKNQLMQDLKLQLFNLALFISSVVLVHVADSVGHESLAKSFEDVRSKGQNLSYEILDVAIQLRHFERFPLSRIREVADDAKGNPMAQRILSFFVLLRLYFFPNELDHRLESQLCESLDIQRRSLRKIAGQGREN